MLIAAGALLKDNETGDVLAQIKLRNISSNVIKAVTVCVQPYDVSGGILGELVEYQYLDIHVSRDAEFGQKTPIVLPNSSARSYSATISEVVFEDNSIWSEDGGVWEPLPKQQSLEDFLGDLELVKQFKIEYGKLCRFSCCEFKDLWLCSCGGINHMTETECYKCGNLLKSFESLNVEELKRSREARLAEEEKQKEIAAAATRAAIKKTKKLGAIIVPIVAVIIAALLLTSKVLIPNAKYNDALSLMEAGEYEEAYNALVALDGYKDSEAYLEQCKSEIAKAELNEKYSDAIVLMKSGKFKESKAAFESLGDYEKSESYLEKLELAIEFTSSKDYSNLVALSDNGLKVSYDAERQCVVYDYYLTMEDGSVAIVTDEEMQSDEFRENVPELQVWADADVAEFRRVYSANTDWIDKGISLIVNFCVYKSDNSVCVLASSDD